MTKQFAHGRLPNGYLWSAVQEVSYSFSHEVLPQLLKPTDERFAADPRSFVNCWVSGALFEIIIGLGLLLGSAPAICMRTAFTMHGALLALLFLLRENSGVWRWNSSLILIIMVLTGRHDTSTWRTLTQLQSRLGTAPLY